MIADMEDADKKKVYVLAKKDWHHGVIGIVASRIVDRFYKPAILISLKDNIGKGSGRSVKGFNLFDALTHCSDLLLKYGGHELAAGLGLNYADIDAFDKAINTYAEDVLKTVDLTPCIHIDTQLQAADLTLAAAQAISILEPFGMGNPQPVFALNGVTLTAARTLSDGKHCKLSVTKNGKPFDFLGFGMGAMAEQFHMGEKLDIAFTMGINVFRGERNLQLIIKDARMSVG
jgi:single-stranded-DNA-specific exonuclease